MSLVAPGPDAAAVMEGGRIGRGPLTSYVTASWQSPPAPPEEPGRRVAPAGGRAGGAGRRPKLLRPPASLGGRRMGGSADAFWDDWVKLLSRSISSCLSKPGLCTHSTD